MVNLLRIVRAPLLGELLVQGLNVLIHLFVFRVGVAAGDRLTTEVRRAYLAPNPTWLSRTGLLAFPRQVPLQEDRPISALFHEIDDGLRRHFRDTPTLICWAERDRLLSSDVLHQWLATLPDARVVRFPNAGHFLPEDAPEELASTLVGFLRSLGCPRTGGTGPREFQP
jgi:haloalkane dehalogenase